MPLKRNAIDQLICWKTEANRLPVLLKGAKGVGKTFLAYDYAKAFFQHIYYINFEREPQLAELFHETGEKAPGYRLMDYFQKEVPQEEGAQTEEEKPLGDRVLILDEISFSREAMTAVQEGRLQPVFEYIIVISSHPLPEELSRNYIQLSIRPLEFDEFLKAIGSDWYVEAIANHFQADKKMPEIVHKELLALYQLYLQIGGMPGSINEYLNLQSSVNVSEQHSFINGSYRRDILRDNNDSDALKMNQVLDSLVYQLMKDNRKFQYKIIRKGTTHTMYREAIHRLCEQNYTIRCSRISPEQLTQPSQSQPSPDASSFYEDGENTNFKLYLPDTGVLYSQLVEVQGKENMNKYEKVLHENCVAQSLSAKNDLFFFWESNSTAKVDFILLRDGELLPIEIFTGENTRSKSISVLKQNCAFPYSIKISSRNFEFTNDTKYVPYYAVFCI